MDHRNLGPRNLPEFRRTCSTRTHLTLSDNNGKARSIEIYNPGIYIYTYLYLLKLIVQRT